MCSETVGVIMPIFMLRERDGGWRRSLAIGPLAGELVCSIPNIVTQMRLTYASRWQYPS